MLVCPQKAIAEVPRKIGIARRGFAKGVRFVDGKMDIGAIQTPSMIKYVKRSLEPSSINIVDAPPGTSCPVVTALGGADFALLVTEPTPFGLNDLKLAIAMVKELALPFGVVINRCDIGDDKMREYCDGERIDIMMELPNDRKVAENYSQGVIIYEAMSWYRENFESLYRKIEEKLSKNEA